MSTIVMKFGGTSIEDAPSIERVTEIVRRRLDLWPVVVISAIGKTTRNLLTAATLSAAGNGRDALAKLEEIRHYHFGLAKALVKESRQSELWMGLTGNFEELRKLLEGLSVLRELTLRSQDKILSYGELISSAIITAAFRERGIDAVLLDARDFIITDERFTHAQPIEAITNQRINEHVRLALESGHVPIVQGFIGSTRDGSTTTLGFEGSDYTAALVGAALEASDIEIWKAVPGIMTSDPDIFAGVHTVKSVSFAEAGELTFFGAKVLHPSAIHPARSKSIPMHIYNSRKPEATGTVISACAAIGTNIIKSIAYKRPVSILNVAPSQRISPYDFLKAVFDVLNRERITPNIITTDEASVALAISASEKLEPLVDDLNQFGEVHITNQRATVSLIGENIRVAQNLPTIVFKNLNGKYIDMISHGASPICFTFVVHESEVRDVIARLHHLFFQRLDPNIFE
ncbi:MAG: aspartate kinase [Bacteroidota bacterium]